MGYYTYFSIEARDASDADMPKIVDSLRRKGVIGYAVDENLDGLDAVKWYEEERDMTEVSIEFPHVYFIVNGEGEDREDIWEHHYRNGMFQELYASLVFPELDPDGWRESEYAQSIRIKNDVLPDFEANVEAASEIMGLTS